MTQPPSFPHEHTNVRQHSARLTAQKWSDSAAAQQGTCLGASAESLSVGWRAAENLLPNGHCHKAQEQQKLQHRYRLSLPLPPFAKPWETVLAV